MRAAGQVAGQNPPKEHEPGPCLSAYRAAVADMRVEFAGLAAADRPGKLEAALARWAAAPELAAVLHATPHGLDAAIERLHADLRGCLTVGRNAPVDLGALVRIHLLSQIDAVWWGGVPAYPTDDHVRVAADLVDLEPLRRGGYLLFRYRRQPTGLAGRAARGARRRLRVDRSPYTAGLRLPRARPETIAMLNLLATGFARTAPPDTPPLWVASLTRSAAYEHHLRALGYAATPPSAHCVGYAADVEMRWFERYGAHRALAEVLLDGQQRGDLNVIDEEPAWHVCLSPPAVAHLRMAGRTQPIGMVRRLTS